MRRSARASPRPRLRLRASARRSGRASARWRPRASKRLGARMETRARNPATWKPSQAARTTSVPTKRIPVVVDVLKAVGTVAGRALCRVQRSKQMHARPRTVLPARRFFGSVLVHPALVQRQGVSTKLPLVRVLHDSPLPFPLEQLTSRRAQAVLAAARRRCCGGGCCRGCRRCCGCCGRHHGCCWGRRWWCGGSHGCCGLPVFWWCCKQCLPFFFQPRVFYSGSHIIFHACRVCDCFSHCSAALCANKYVLPCSHTQTMCYRKRRHKLEIRNVFFFAFFPPMCNNACSWHKIFPVQQCWCWCCSKVFARCLPAIVGQTGRCFENKSCQSSFDLFIILRYKIDGRSHRFGCDVLRLQISHDTVFGRFGRHFRVVNM